MHKSQFRSVLKDDELNNIETVKNYLQYSFRNRKPKKDYKLYINICKIYNSYPNTIKDLLNNIPTLGYYKDYFYILMFSRNQNLDKIIYDIVIDQLNQDLGNLKNKKEISTLGKWLPRENSKINKQCNFIDKFNIQFFPHATDKFNARRKYRKLKTMLNEKLGTLEAKMCTNRLSEINFNKVSYMALERNKEALMKHDECRDKMDLHETEVLKKMTLSEFTRELIINKRPIDKMVNLWQNNRFRMEVPYLDKMIANSVCIIDLSKDTFGNNGEYFAFGMALLVNHFSNVDKKVIVNNNFVNLRGDITEQAQQLLKYAGPMKPISIEKYHSMVSQECKTLVFVTNKQIDNIEFLGDKSITFLQFVPNKKGYDIVHYTGDKVRKFTKYEHPTNKNTEIHELKKDISVIIEKSAEFKDMRSPIYILLFFFMITILLRLYEYFYL